jgi:hypothetical protein
VLLVLVLLLLVLLLLVLLLLLLLLLLVLVVVVVLLLLLLLVLLLLTAGSVMTVMCIRPRNGIQANAGPSIDLPTAGSSPSDGSVNSLQTLARCRVRRCRINSRCYLCSRLARHKCTSTCYPAWFIHLHVDEGNSRQRRERSCGLPSPPALHCLASCCRARLLLPLELEASHLLSGLLATMVCGNRCCRSRLLLPLELEASHLLSGLLAAMVCGNRCCRSRLLLPLELEASHLLSGLLATMVCGNRCCCKMLSMRRREACLPLIWLWPLSVRWEPLLESSIYM